MPVNFITFSAGDNKYFEAAKRIIEQASILNLFENIIGYNDVFLKNDYEFWKTHCDFFNEHKKGYGYWIWKPYIIKKTLERMNDDDILLYCDCGCELLIEKRDELVNAFDKVNSELIICSNTSALEKYRTKIDLINYFSLNQESILNSIQKQASCILMKKCNKIIQLVNEWYETSYSFNYKLLIDSFGKSANNDFFGVHRHDQSIFSLLIKKYNLDNNIELDNIVHVARNIKYESIFEKKKLQRNVFFR